MTRHERDPIDKTEAIIYLESDVSSILDALKKLERESSPGSDQAGWPDVVSSKKKQGRSSALFGWKTMLSLLAAGVVVWGLALGVQESTLRAGVADLVPAARRAGAYGIFAAAFGAAWFAGGTLLGYLYERTPAGLVIACLVIQLLALLVLLTTRGGTEPTGAGRAAGETGDGGE